MQWQEYQARQAEYYGNQYTDRSREKFPTTSTHKGRATDVLGDMAGVSGKTYEHATAVICVVIHDSANLADSVRQLSDSQKAWKLNLIEKIVNTSKIEVYNKVNRRKQEKSLKDFSCTLLLYRV